MERTIVGVLLLTPLLLLLPTVSLYVAYVMALHAVGLAARQVLLVIAMLLPQLVVPATWLMWPRAFPGVGVCEGFFTPLCRCGHHRARVCGA